MTAETLDPEFTDLDRHLDDLFSPVRPGASLESRLVYALRNVPARPPLNRTRKAFVWATAASLGLGALGAALSMIDGVDRLPMPGSVSLSANRTTASRISRDAPNAKSPTGERVILDDFAQTYSDGDNKAAQGSWKKDPVAPLLDAARAQGMDGTIRFKNEAAGAAPRVGYPAVNDGFVAGFVPEKQSEGGRIDGTPTGIARSGAAGAGSSDGRFQGLGTYVVDEAGSAERLKNKLAETERFYRRAEEARDKLGREVADESKGRGFSALADADRKAGVTALGGEDKKGDPNSATTYGYFLPGEGVNKGMAPAGKPMGGNGSVNPESFGDKAYAPAVTGGATPSPGFAGGSGRGGFGGGRFGEATKGKDGKVSSEKAVKDLRGDDAEKMLEKLEEAAKKGAASFSEIDALKARIKAESPQPPATTTPTGPGSPAVTPPAPAAAPPVAKKIVIRSGEMEFEVESFDNATAEITKLTAPIPGGFVSTVNSEKLPNGKVRGVVVVRIPPEKLDQFVLDLRRELGKAGELKGQKIGSQDITKQYTDLESRLRAARAMEERLLKMIKEQNGSIKEVLEAEKELGVWRTKIEETEGELKYYANLASLSTLTITVFEKEIRAAAGATEAEQVSTGVEVEDVEAAFREVQNAVADAKGRVTKSELKQLSAGQFSAVLHFEVSPDAAGPIRDRLKQLGRVARLEIGRVLQSDSGPTIAKDAKLKRGDTQFQLALYNLANIAPRETATLTVAAGDVPAAYQALRDAVGRVNGRVFVANLNEKDKQNVSATFEFDVKRADEGAVRAALQAAGDTVSRQVTRAPEGEAVTDTKVLYKLTLESADRIKARETHTLTVSAADVPKAYQALRDAVGKVAGRVLVAQLNEQDKQNVTAVLNFDVKRADEAAATAALAAAGEAIARNVTRAGENEPVTDSKVSYRVTLQSANLIRPRETAVLAVIVPDVADAYQKVRDVAVRNGGQVITAQLNEQDKQNVTATLHVEVKKADEAALKAAVDAAGDVVSRRIARTPEGTQATDAKILFQIEFGDAHRVRPRESTALGIEVVNVDDAVATIVGYFADAKGRQLDAKTRHDPSGRVEARLLYDIPLRDASSVVDKIKGLGKVRVSEGTQDKAAPEGKYATARIEVQLANAEVIVGPDDGIWPRVKKGLAYSASLLLYSLTWIVIGLAVVLPWAALGFGGYRLVKRVIRPATPPAPAQAPPTPPPSEAGH